VLNVLKSGSLNILEPSGPVQACNGIALPLPLLFNINFFGSLCSGDMLIIGAQVVAATQMVLEEKFVSGLDIPALQAVGWEGKYFCTKLNHKIMNCVKFLVNTCLCALL
jgi:hypothetical protein